MLMAASFSLQDPLGVFFMFANRLSHLAVSSVVYNSTCYIVHGKFGYLVYARNLFFVLLSIKRWFCLTLGLYFFLMENNC